MKTEAIPMIQIEKNRLILLLAGLCGVLLATAMAVGSLTADLPSCLFAGLVLLLLWLATCLCLKRWPLFQEKTVGAAVLLYLALCLRLSLFDHISGDYVSFLSVWTETMRNMTVSQALSTPIGDYNMPYLYLILLISRLPFYDLYCIKLCSVIADVAAALAVARLASLVTRRQNVIFLSFAAALLAPTTWLNSAYWGQCDSIYGAFALWGLWCGLKKRPIGSMVLLALALAFKLQAIFLLPIVALLLVEDRVQWRQLPVFPIAFLVVMVPALLGGRSLYDTFSIYWSQTQAYPYLSLNAPAFWSLIDNQYYSELSGGTVLLAMVGVLLLFYLVLERREHLDRTALLELSLILTLGIPWLLPKMHERYFYLAEMLSIAYGAAFPKRAWVSVVLLFGGFLIYSAYLFGEVPILSMRYVAAIYGLLLGYLLLRFFSRQNTKTKQNIEKSR
jgi:Gpi18-like mannosyltransferase